MAESVFRGVIGFLDKIGVYDVILPFLLVFTIMYAILEKTRVLGEDKDSKGNTYTKKNLNSIVAFVIAFFVVASTRLVALLNEAMGNIVVLALVGVCVLMLLGVFYGKNGFDFSNEEWKDSWTLMFFTGFMVIGVLLIFFHAVPLESGESLLEWFYDFMEDNWDDEAVGAIILLGLVALFMWGITNEDTSKTKSNSEKKGE